MVKDKVIFLALVADEGEELLELLGTQKDVNRFSALYERLKRALG